MAFKFKEFDHFLNFINKNYDITEFIESDNETRKNVIDALEGIYNSGKSEKFTWFIKTEYVGVLELESLEVFKNHRKPSISLTNINEKTFWDIENIDQVAGLLMDCDFTGVYVFSKSRVLKLNDTQCFYVGYSENLSNRVIASIKERKKKIKGDFFIHILNIGNKPDAGMLEIYLINFLCPSLNGSMSFSERPEMFVIPEEKIHNLLYKTIIVKR